MVSIMYTVYDAKFTKKPISAVSNNLSWCDIIDHSFNVNINIYQLGLISMLD